MLHNIDDAGCYDIASTACKQSCIGYQSAFYVANELWCNCIHVMTSAFNIGQTDCDYMLKTCPKLTLILTAVNQLCIQCRDM